MLRRIFSALTTLAANVEAFATSIAQANEQFRERLALDHRDDVPALPEPEPARQNGRRTKANT